MKTRVHFDLQTVPKERNHLGGLRDYIYTVAKSIIVTPGNIYSADHLTDDVAKRIAQIKEGVYIPKEGVLDAEHVAKAIMFMKPDDLELSIDDLEEMKSETQLMHRPMVRVSRDTLVDGYLGGNSQENFGKENQFYVKYFIAFNNHKWWQVAGKKLVAAIHKCNFDPQRDMEHELIAAQDFAESKGMYLDVAFDDASVLLTYQTPSDYLENTPFMEGKTPEPLDTYKMIVEFVKKGTKLASAFSQMHNQHKAMIEGKVGAHRAFIENQSLSGLEKTLKQYR